LHSEDLREIYSSLNTVRGSHTTGRSEGRGIWPVKHRREMNTRVLWEKLKEKDHLENVSVDVVIIINWINKIMLGGRGVD